MAGTAADLLRVAEGQVGVEENPPQSNHVPYWCGIGRCDGNGEPWCACFVTWCMIQAKVPFPTIDTPGGYVYCPDALTWAKYHGAIVSSGQQQPGDIILFQWGDQQADHTGFFLRNNSDGTITTIEGNASMPNGNDGVNYHIREMWEVLAFVRPPYGDGGTPPSPVPVGKPGVDWGAVKAFIDACHTKTLRRGSSGPVVGYLQGRLHALGYNVPGMVDPNPATAAFGPATEAGVRKFQADHALAVDGVVGPLTWKAMDG